MEKFPKVKVITLIVVLLLLSITAGYYILNTNKIKILGCGYFFGANPKNPNQTITYIYLKLSAPVHNGDIIHIYKNESDFYYKLVTWKVNSTQDGKTNITIPLDMLDNLNGSMDIYIKRGNSYLYRGKISFSVHPHLDVSVTNIHVRPVSAKYAYITNVHLLIKSQRPIYICGLNFTVFNMNIYKEVNSVIYGVKKVNISVSPGKVVQLVQKGIVPVKITLLYPAYPDNLDKPEKYPVDSECVINFTYPPVVITNFSIYNSSSYPSYIFLLFQLSRFPDYPVHIIVYKLNGTIIGEGYGVGIGKNDTVFISVPFPPNYNFNGTYVAVLEDNYGFALNSLTFTLKSGPLKLISHEEIFNETNDPNKVILRSLVLKLENLGNFNFYITHYEYKISFISNGTVAASGDYTWFYQAIPPREFTNVTLPFYVHLIKGKTYKISLTFEGGNKNVKCTIDYTFKA